MDDFRIRHFEDSDAESASEMLCESFQWFHKGNRDSWLWKNFEPSSLIAASKNLDIHVAIQGENRVVGFISCSTAPYMVAYIPTVAVAQKLQNKGYGKKLLDYTLDYLEQKGVRKVWLLVTSTNTSAITFYLKNNFVIEGYLTDHTGPGLDEVLFSKFIAPK